VPKENETLEERITRKQEEALAAKRHSHVVSGNGALATAKEKLESQDHASARSAFMAALKSFKAGGIDKPELVQMERDISCMEHQAAAADQNAQAEEEEKNAAAAAASAASFRAEAEAKATQMKTEQDARAAEVHFFFVVSFHIHATYVSHACGRFSWLTSLSLLSLSPPRTSTVSLQLEELAAAVAAKAQEEDIARMAAVAKATALVAKEEAAAEKVAQKEEQLSAASAFAERKRKEKESREAARPASASTALPRAPAQGSTLRSSKTTPKDAQRGQELPAHMKSDGGIGGVGKDVSWGNSGGKALIYGIEHKPSGEAPIQGITSHVAAAAAPQIDVAHQRSDKSVHVQIPASPGGAPAVGFDRDAAGSLSPSTSIISRTESSKSCNPASLQPDPELWSNVLGHLEDADVHSKGIVSEFTATRMLKSMGLPLSEDAWRHAVEQTLVAVSPSKGKRIGSLEPGVRYRELVVQLQHLHERALRHQRVEAVIAAVNMRGATHLSDTILALSAETLSNAHMLEEAINRVLLEPPISLPEHLLQTAKELGHTHDGQLHVERLLNKLAKSVEKDAFGPVRKALHAKYGRLKDAFLAITKVPGAQKKTGVHSGELAISMDQLRSVLVQLGASMVEADHIVSIADADGSGGIDYKEFCCMFSNRITAIRKRSIVLPMHHHASQSPHHDSSSRSMRRHSSLPLTPHAYSESHSQDHDPAEQSMLRQLAESNWSLGDAFRALDRDGKGVIASSELRARLRELGIELSFNETARILAKVDANNDGSISFSEFVSRYRLEPLLSSQAHEALSDTAMALKSQYKSPIQAFQAACAGSAMLTRARFKTFIRSLGLHLHAATIEQLCTDVDNQSTADTLAYSHAPSDFVSFVDFLQLFRLEGSTLGTHAQLSRRASWCTGDGVSITQLEEALRERMRLAFGTLKAAFTTIDKDHNGVITRGELRHAMTTPPLNLGFDFNTIDAIIEHADQDGNGKIDFIEFSQVCAQHLTHHSILRIVSCVRLCVSACVCIRVCMRVCKCGVRAKQRDCRRLYARTLALVYKGTQSELVCCSACVYEGSQSELACCNVLQCVAVCCSVLQCVAVCCSVGVKTHSRHSGTCCQTKIAHKSHIWQHTNFGTHTMADVLIRTVSRRASSSPGNNSQKPARSYICDTK